MIIVDENNAAAMERWRDGLSEDFRMTLCGFLMDGLPWDWAVVIIGIAFSPEDRATIIEVLQGWAGVPSGAISKHIISFGKFAKEPRHERD